MQPLYPENLYDLTALCQRLRSGSFIALDTEFMREKTYYPQLCLIQVATEDVIACIDPFAFDNLDPLLEVLYDPTITKVLHAARQDLEIFHHLRGRPPAPVFDTQLAATLLGQGEQVGYAALVKEVLGVSLDKAHTRADWSQRPLSPEELAYAMDDVRYLVPLYLHQRTALELAGRLAWLQEDFAELSQPVTYMAPPEEAWLRVKGANYLKGVQLAVLQQLASWRERMAQQDDRPRRWVLKDEIMIDLARQMPADLMQMARIRGIERQTMERHGTQLLACIQQARERPRGEWPQLEMPQRLTAVQEPLLDAMMALVRLRAMENSVSAPTLAPRREVERMLGGAPDTILHHGWRARLVGQDLEALLCGKLHLVVEEGRLRAVATPP